MHARALFIPFLTTLTIGCASPNTAFETAGDGSTGAATDDTGATTGAATDDTGGTTDSRFDTSSSTTADADVSTSGATTIASTGTTDDGPAPMCGDGNLDDGEECDDGPDNGPGQACRIDCHLNVCGDGDIGPDELCDDGSANMLQIDACAPDCSKVIDVKEIVIAPGPLLAFGVLRDGDLGSDPVATVDGLCPVTHKALFAVPGSRQGAASSYEPDPIDWVLQPFTGYVDGAGELVWMTDGSALLGVRDGEPASLEKGITNNSAARIITGINQDWTTAITTTCDGWSSSSDALSVSVGNPNSTEEYLRGASTRPCAPWNAPLHQGAKPTKNLTTVYCVEQ